MVGMKRTKKKIVARDEHVLDNGRFALESDIPKEMLRSYRLTCTELVGDTDDKLLLIQDRSEGSEDEHPELAFRRGLQHGAVLVSNALEDAGVLTPELTAQVYEYAHGTLHGWRYPHRDRERWNRNRCAPRLTLDPKKRGTLLSLSPTARDSIMRTIKTRNAA
jgi:hypothetical protein